MTSASDDDFGIGRSRFVRMAKLRASSSEH
jgi:hypothetical protein